MVVSGLSDISSILKVTEAAKRPLQKVSSGGKKSVTH